MKNNHRGHHKRGHHKSRQDQHTPLWCNNLKYLKEEVNRLNDLLYTPFHDRERPSSLYFVLHTEAPFPPVVFQVYSNTMLPKTYNEILQEFHHRIDPTGECIMEPIQWWEPEKDTKSGKPTGRLLCGSTTVDPREHSIEDVEEYLKYSFPQGERFCPILSDMYAWRNGVELPMFVGQ